MAVTYPRHEAVIAWAKTELANHVGEQPPGSNTGDRVRFYQGHTWLPGTGWPWCAAFVCTAWAEAGKPLPWPTAGAFDMGNRARASGWTVQSVSRLRPGDIVVWNIGAGHVSLFASYDPHTGLIHTIDGNVSDQVGPRARPVSQARDLIMVPETAVAAKPVPPKTMKPPVFQVVTGEDEKVIYVSGARAVGKNLARILKAHPAGVTIRRKKS